MRSWRFWVVFTMGVIWSVPGMGQTTDCEGDVDSCDVVLAVVTNAVTTADSVRVEIPRPSGFISFSGNPKEPPEPNREIVAGANVSLLLDSARFIFREDCPDPTALTVIVDLRDEFSRKTEVRLTALGKWFQGLLPVPDSKYAYFRLRAETPSGCIAHDNHSGPGHSVKLAPWFAPSQITFGDNPAAPEPVSPLVAGQHLRVDYLVSRLDAVSMIGGSGVPLSGCTHTVNGVETLGVKAIGRFLDQNDQFIGFFGGHEQGQTVITPPLAQLLGGVGSQRSKLAPVPATFKIPLEARKLELSFDVTNAKGICSTETNAGKAFVYPVLAPRPE